MSHVMTDINRNGHQTYARSPTCHERKVDNVIDSHPVDLSSPKPQNRFGHMSYVISRETPTHYNSRQPNYENGMDTNQSEFSSKCGNVFYFLFLNLFCLECVKVIFL